MTTPIGQLVIDFCNGNKQAGERLFRSFRSMAFHESLRLAKNPHDAEDIAHDTVVRAIRKISTIQNPSSFPQWFKTINKRIGLDQMRTSLLRRRRQCELSEEIDVADKQYDDFPAYQLEIVLKAIKELNAYDVQVLGLIMNGMEYKDIAKELGVPLGTVKRRVFIARQRLRQKLIEQGHQDALPRERMIMV